ncbi:MAG: lectin-like protein [Candidatus Krumholzibacteria bacterium]|nr:lectin-like protein [Candidatus Krumholzibacteria bacterium]
MHAAKVVAILLALLPPFAVRAESPVQWLANGHWYQMVMDSAVTWESARVSAESMVWMDMPGHLVTVNSQEEYDFLAASVWNNRYIYGWIGAFQDSPSLPAGEGWQWVTGEPWDYTRWCSGEPNDYYGPGSEDCGDMYPGGWNDTGCGGWAHFVVEYEGVTAVEEASWSTIRALYRTR